MYFILYFNFTVVIVLILLLLFYLLHFLLSKGVLSTNKLMIFAF